MLLEPVFVSFEWSNPMQVPIPVNNVYLKCSFDDEPVPNSEAFLNGSAPVSRIEHEHFDVEVLSDAALDSNEKKRLRLKIFPKAEGTIKVLGIQFLLCGIIPSYRPFRKMTRGPTPSPLPLVISVTPPMPVLELSFHNFPEELLNGQVCNTMLELHNKGGKGLTALYLKTSNPTFFYIDDGTKLVESSYSMI